ncbi:hypothetical protein [Paenibacillus sp. B2(2019)]|uniref:hypothetical protein n=1 Tax=Paenibacillus sp. B2(2019) TaxID=2607754 RepID=UPI00165EE4AA|nr:hypothetical protein [Paenibacillus sp. B2(2019)]
MLIRNLMDRTYKSNTQVDERLYAQVDVWADELADQCMTHPGSHKGQSGALGKE